jgi:uncharacterized protein YecT (DUF1311 family)
MVFNFEVSKMKRIKLALAVIMSSLALGCGGAAANASEVATKSSYECDPSGNMREMEVCASLELIDAESVMQEYLKLTLKNFERRADTDLYSDLMKNISENQLHWETYMESSCKTSTFENRMGTIYSFVLMQCKTEFNRNRAIFLWQNFLQPSPSDSSDRKIPPYPKFIEKL